MSQHDPNRLDYATPQKTPGGVGAAVGGCITGIAATGFLGFVLAFVLGRAIYLGMIVFAALAVGSLIGWLVSRDASGSGRRFLAWMLIGIGCTSLLEGFCYFQFSR